MKSVIIVFSLVSILLQSNTSPSQTVSRFNPESQELQDIVCYGRGGQYGYNKAGSGDVNGDGYDDLLVPTVGQDKAYLYLGGEIVDTIPDVVFEGPAFSGFGGRVDIVGDMNGDGFDDIVISAPRYQSGRAFLYFGGPSVNNVIDLTFQSPDPAPVTFGSAVTKAGDFNGDTYSDILIVDKSIGRGKGYLYYGGSVVNSVCDRVISLEFNNELGTLASDAGDLNDDGFDDIMLMAPPGSSAGRSVLYVYFGANFGDNIVSTYIYSDSSSYFTSIDFAGDVNGDGYSDIIAATSGYYGLWTINKALLYLGGTNLDTVPDLIFQNLGRETIVSGIGNINADGFSDFTISSLFGSSVSIYSGSKILDTNPDYVVSASISGESFFGRSVSSAGDMNNDGFNDFAVGSDLGLTGQGLVHIYFFNNILLSPADNSTNIPLSTNLIWRGFSTATHYYLSVAEDSLFENIFYSDTLTSDTSAFLNNLVRDRQYFWKVNVRDTSGSIYNSAIWKFSTIPPLMLDLRVLFEGMYYPLFNLLSRRDTVKVSLRENVSPYDIVDSASGVIDSLSFRSLFKFYNALSGEYYVVINHFNSLETWSSSGIYFPVSDTASYDFTTSSSQAYGNNLKRKGTKYCIFTGDINQSGFIDGSDAIRVHSDSQIFLTGFHLISDLNGDNIVDGTDYSLVDNNAFNFVGVVKP